MNNEIGLYIHIPFCISKCTYCDFCSFDNKIELKRDYIEALKKEIINYRELTKDSIIKTIFLGGGTPTVLEADEIEEIFNVVKENFTIKEDAEITIEANPGTLSLDKLKALRAIGINRLSMGLQSANNNILKEIGRIHTYEEFEQDVKDARIAGFTNINADIMFSLPNQTMEDIKDVVKKLTDLNIEHISAYSLTLEGATPLAKKVYSGEIEIPTEDEDREYYYEIVNTLKSLGYHHYEISNFAKEGNECEHNIIYWDSEEYLGLGVAAHSYFGGYRFSNITSVERYIGQMDEGKIGFKRSTREKIRETDKMSEFMFLGLRKLDGVDRAEFDKKFSVTFDELFGEVVNEMIEDGVLFENGSIIGLTERGIDVSNVIFAEFLL